MYKGELLLRGQRQRVGPGLVQGIAIQHNFSPEAAGAFHFDAGCEAWHHNHGAQPQSLGVVGHPLGVIAGAHGDHAMSALVRGELRQLVAGAALFEGGGELQVLEFEEHLRPGDVGQGAGRHARRSQQVALQACGRSLDVVELNHGGIVRRKRLLGSPLACNNDGDRHTLTITRKTSCP